MAARRRDGLKGSHATRASAAQARRREDALERQRRERLDRANLARQLAEAAAAEAEEAAEAHAGATRARDAAWWGAQLQQPEWLVDVPHALGRGWLAFPRPEGPRCVVVAGGGWTVARSRAGRHVVRRFPSALPGGSRRTREGGGRGGEECCVLDAVFCHQLQTFFVLDVVCWKGHSLYDTAAEFRLFWRDSRLAESGAGDEPSPSHRYRFVPVPAYDATADGVAAAHHAPVPFRRDGVLLVSRESHYAPGPPTPVALLWKDAACSPYLLDTDADGNVPQYQAVALRVLLDGTVATGDEPPVALGCLPEEYRRRAGDKLAPGQVLRFTIRDGGLVLGADGRPTGADLHFEGAVRDKRRSADFLTKVLFQYNARRSPVTLEELLAAAARGEAVDTSSTAASM